MGEIKVGEYVRTKEGIIDKVIIDYKGKCNDPNCSEKHISCRTNYYCEKDVVKHSENIIDLIEVGDIIEEQYGDKTRSKQINNIEMLDRFRNGDIIKSIVTKEQFEQIKYEV